MVMTSSNAVQELKGIFPSWDVDTLEIMLQQHGGDVEHTVTTLCSMVEETTPAAESQPASTNPVPSSSSSLSSSPAAALPMAPTSSSNASGTDTDDEALARRLQDQLDNESGMPGLIGGQGAHFGRKIRVPIPDDFLQIPGEYAGDSHAAANYSDEIVARMMQDELIMARRQQIEQQQNRFNAAGGFRYPTQHRRAPSGPSGPSISEQFAKMKEAATKRFDNLFKKDESAARSRSKRAFSGGDDDDDDENEQLISFDSDMVDVDMDEHTNKKRD